MGFFSNLFSGVVSAATRNAGVVHIEDLCAQLNWGIDERVGDSGIMLHFKDPVFGIRPVLIAVGTQGGLCMISSRSNAKIPAARIPGQLACYLLTENGKTGLFAWSLSANDDGTGTFVLSCMTPVPALTPQMFQHLCTSMAAAAADFDAKLRQAGLL